MILRALDHQVGLAKIDELTRYDSRYYTWQIMGAAALSDYVKGVHFYSGIDYARFADEGDSYLKGFWSPSWYAIERAHNDKGFLRAQKAAKSFVASGTFKAADHSAEDILAMAESNFVIALVPYGKLYNNNVKAAHSILIYKVDAHDVWFHDPGLPPRPSQRMSRERYAALHEPAGDFIVVPKSSGGDTGTIRT